LRGVIRAVIFKINYALNTHRKSEINRKGAKVTYKPLEVLGPEHEFSLVDKNLNILPIADKIIKEYCGRMVNFIELPNFTFGKEMTPSVSTTNSRTYVLICLLYPPPRQYSKAKTVPTKTTACTFTR